MATRKKSKNNLSRRNFIKTTTAATAAASIGLVSETAFSTSNQASGSPPATWTITGRQIQALWTKIHPKLLALSWLFPDYRAAFKADTQFRKKEALRIAAILRNAGILNVDYNSNIDILIPEDNPGGEDDILSNAMPKYVERTVETANQVFQTQCFSNIYGDTFFMLNRHGIIIPWPEAPNLKEAFVAYNQGSGVLPRDSPPWLTGPPNLELKLFQDISRDGPTGSLIRVNQGWRDYISPNPLMIPQPFPTEGLSGVSLLSLFERWPRMIALSWFSKEQNGNDDIHDDIMKYPKKYILPEVWSEWPRTHVSLKVITKADDFVFRSIAAVDEIRMDVPLPNKPVSPQDIYQELVVGYATNPLYTNTY